MKCVFATVKGSLYMNVDKDKFIIDQTCCYNERFCVIFCYLPIFGTKWACDQCKKNIVAPDAGNLVPSWLRPLTT